VDRSELIERIDQQERDTGPLRQRIDADRQRIDPDSPWAYKPRALADFHTFKDTDSHSFFLKVVTLIATAKMLINTTQSADKSNEEEGNDKERFVRGGFRAADESLRSIIKPSLMSQLASYAADSGWVTGVALLQKRHIPGASRWQRLLGQPTTTSHFYVMPFDPRWTYHEADANGLLWICQKSLMSPQEIRDFYHKEVPISGSATRSTERNIPVYDCYDAAENYVYTKDDVLKTPQKHGCPRTPGFAIPVGPTPLRSNSENSVDIEHYGESCLRGVRKLSDEINLVMSAMGEFTIRSLKRPMVYESDDGSKTL